jgi:hypothetical protein
VFRSGEGKMERRYCVDVGDLQLNWATQNIGTVSLRFVGAKTRWR